MTTQVRDATAVDESSARYAGWRVVFACYLAAVFCWGYGLYGHGVYLTELNRLHGWPTSLIAAATTVFYLATATLVVFISDAIARLGPRLVMLIGGGSFVVAVTLLAFIDALWQLYIAYLIMAVGAASMHVGAISNVLGLWFDRRRGLALSLALNGASSGGILITPALVLAIAHYGFVIAMVGSAVVMVLGLRPAIALWIGTPTRPAPPAAGSASGDPARADAAPAWTRRSALRSLAFWSVAAPFAMALTAQVGFLVHQIAMLEPALGRPGAGLSVATLTVAAITGRFVLGAFATTLNMRRVTAWSVLSQAAALGVLLLTTDPIGLFFGCALFGLSAGNLLTLPALIIQREFEAAAFGMLIGLSWAVSQFTYAFGPGVLGVVRDLTGGYGAPLALCIALEIGAAVLVLTRPGTSRPSAGAG
jgi:MFS family permease